MANVKTTPDEWTKAREYYEAGLLLREIEDKTGIAIPSISKKAKAEGWAKESEKKTLLQAAVQVGAAKANLNDTALEVHNELVNERVKRQEWLNIQALRNVKESMAHLCESQSDYRARADTISKAKEVVIGKAPDTAIQINNAEAAGLKINLVQYGEQSPDQ
ncbi:hypothetical protein [Ferrovum sp.]|uniref:hypothetical protein n=1 Tax=Ferrovum sp. TaxID=2609467 RepID=UPI002603ACC5|nr:hypothetical protein [Ferrovum sp.]